MYIYVCMYVSSSSSSRVAINLNQSRIAGSPGTNNTKGAPENISMRYSANGHRQYTYIPKWSPTPWPKKCIHMQSHCINMSAEKIIMILQ